LALAVAVAMDPPLLFEDFDDRVEFEVAPRREAPAIAFPALPLLAVVERGIELVDHQLVDPHPRLRIATGTSLAPIALLDVFTQGELDARWSSVEFHLRRVRSPA